MSERPNDAPGEPIEGAGAEAPIDNEADSLQGEDAPQPDGTDEDLDEGGASKPEAEAARDEAAALAAEADVERARGMRPSERRAARAAERSQIPVDPSLRITDRASALFVLVTVLAFGLILLNGLVLGKGGFLAPIPTPSPVPVLTSSPSPAVAPGGSPTAAPSP
ncbi:MAG: hypothetical protein C0498_14000, partial [Anaerolinea sp.]|nr:hypothetical protein [Anaerolinea sp.]